MITPRKSRAAFMGTNAVRNAAPKKKARKQKLTPAAIEANELWHRLKDGSPFFFQFLGYRDGWYALRATLTVGNDALTFENEVIEWLIEQRITPGKHSHIGNGNVGNGPWLPTVHDGSAMCLLLKRAVDVARLEMRFPCRGITPETMLEALRIEARVVRVGPVEIAKVAYDANRRLDILHGNVCPEWDDCAEIDRRMFVTTVEIHMDHLDWNAEQIHEHWVRTRTEAGWVYGPERSFEHKTHPSLIPFHHLTPLEKAKDQLFTNVVAALLPLVEN